MKALLQFFPFLWASLSVCPAAQTSVALDRGTEQPGQSFGVEQHPALAALARNAPRDKKGKIIAIPKMDFASLSDPLDGRYALLSGNHEEFTIVPQGALLFIPDSPLAKEVVRSQMPNASFLSTQAFLAQEQSRFSIISIVPDSNGFYRVDEMEKQAWIKEASHHLILLIDQTSGLPISNLSKGPGKSPGKTVPSS